MRVRQHTNVIREGEYLVEVDLQVLDDEEGVPGWGPYYGAPDIEMFQRIRAALHAGRLHEVPRNARIYRLVPVTTD